MRRRIVMDTGAIDRAIRRMAHEIAEANQGLQHIALVGIHSGGVELTRRLHQRLMEIENTLIPVGMLDITLYRDDLTINDQPMLKSTDIEFDIAGLNIVLVDDVIFTSRTIRAAMDALMDLGRPSKIQVATLVDRGGRELPIQPNYVGITLSVDPKSKVNVELTGQGGHDRVLIEEVD